ncbi:TIGR03491, putative RecB family nuclease, TM0106 family [Mycobacteriaceae bacterium]
MYQRCLPPNRLSLSRGLAEEGDEWSVTAAGDPVVLDGYAAKRCPVRIHNNFSPLVLTLKEVRSEEQQAIIDAGNAFEAEIFAELLKIHPTAVLVDPRLGKYEAIAMTVAAAECGAPLVLGGTLPDDIAGGRSGKPDILIKVDGGYLPADVKHHKTIELAKRKAMRVSSLVKPGILLDAERSTISEHYYDDCLQLAHYTRMLQACGLHPGDDRLTGAILGKSLVRLADEDPERVFVWYDLAAPVRYTFSRSRGKVRRSILECYDHEHDFRVQVAARACRITGSGDDPEPLVVPIGYKDCPGCPYEQWCAEQMGPDDASVAITRGRLDTREWRTLRRMGFRSVEALAGLEPENPAFFDEYYPEVAHLSRNQALKRLRGAVQQAQLIREGIFFEPKADSPVDVPRAEIEIDFDIEWDKSNRIYQWGLRVREGQDEVTARYEPVVSFDDLDDDAELALAEQAAARIMQLRVEAEKAGKTVAVYHWHHVEVSNTRNFGCVTAALDGITLDLLSWFAGTFRVRGSAGIKTIAQLFGFNWAVDDPGGRLSMLKIDVARAGGPDAAEAKQWCLDYNESDVAAQAVIRDGLRAMFPDGKAGD